ncbi:MAG: carboxypeptidase-like regulatory domain-containing protein [Coriobacteriia bacterium]|nr:carboxypeptidase-like regulatory domain-containing protein [Coriobacteriia bacterium]
MEPLEEFTITFETNMSPDVAYSLGGRQVATVNYDITEVQTYVNAKLNFHESSITPEGEKAISRNGWILKDGLYQKKEVKNSEIAPELAPLEEGMATGSIQKMYMMFTEWTILTVEDEPKVVDIFSKDVTIDAQWVDRPGLRGFVVDNAGEPVEGAIVNIYNKNTGEIVQSLITDENGKYIFENLPLGVEYYITYEKSGTPNLVAPTKEFTSYETIGELGNNEVTDESTVKGKIEGAPLSPQTWAVFYADDGSKYVAPVDSLGNYSLPVPAEQKGNLLFENDNPEVIIPGTPGLTTPGAGETSTLPNKNNLPKNQCESFSLNLQPAVEGAQFVISQYNYTDGNEYAFEATSDHDGNATLYAMPNLPGTIEVTYYDPFSRQNISYTQDVDGINAGEQFILDIDATKLRTVAMSISP